MNHAEHHISGLSGGAKRSMVWQAWLVLLAGLIVTALAAGQKIAGGCGGGKRVRLRLQ